MDLIPFGLGALALFMLLHCLSFGGRRTGMAVLIGLLTLSGLLLRLLDTALPPGFGSFAEPLIWHR